MAERMHIVDETRRATERIYEGPSVWDAPRPKPNPITLDDRAVMKAELLAGLDPDVICARYRVSGATLWEMLRYLGGPEAALARRKVKALLSPAPRTPLRINADRNEPAHVLRPAKRKGRPPKTVAETFE